MEDIQDKMAAQAQSTLIPMSEIDDNHEFNCRGKIAISDITWLAQDITKHGLLQPVVVRPLVFANFKYRLVAGFSRFKALKVLRWENVPCVIRNCTDEEAMYLNLTENIQRKDLNMLQEAKALRKMMITFPSCTEEVLAEKLGQSRGWVQVRKYILELPEECHDEIAKGKVTYEQIRQIWAMKGADRLVAIRKIKEAIERGIKVKLYDKKPKPMDELAPRSRLEIYAMQEHIVKSLKTNNFGTRCLAWAAGKISDLELFGDIANIADNEEIPYEIPKEPLPKAVL